MVDQDLAADLQVQVAQAIASQTPLRIVGSGSKAFYGATTSATEPLLVSGHSGVIAYEPSELVITVRAGTPLQTVEAVLAEQGQYLGFEPPHFGANATIGGTLACGFSGPRRPFAGSARDFMLGCQVLNGQAEIVNFGGQVIKNVAGFDVSRLMVGALGQLGILLNTSLKVLPKPEAEMTLCFSETNADAALAQMQRWQRQAWPISGLAYVADLIRLRLSGAEAALCVAAQQLGGDVDNEGEYFWQALREQQLAFFQANAPLWRVSVPPATPMLDLPGDWLIDWGGAQRWLISSAAADTIHTVAQAHAGHATGFRRVQSPDWLRLEPSLWTLHQRVKQAFDPQGLFNPQCFNPSL